MKPFVASSTSSTEKIVLLCLIMACATFHSCKKSDAPPQPPVSEAPKTKAGKLKEIVSQNLPNPLYHFEYTDEGVPTSINYASGFYIYSLQYVDGRLDRMINTFNSNAMVYHYTNGKVSSIRDQRPDGRLLWNYSFDYTPQGQLWEVRWYRFHSNGIDSVLLRKSTLEYRTDGNLAWFNDYYNTTGQLEWLRKVEYTNYDKEKNVDDFSLLKQFDDNLIYLPGVRLQVNNARNELLTTVDNDYEFINTFQYQNSRPTQKMVRVVKIRGTDPGNLGDYATTYSYY